MPVDDLLAFTLIVALFGFGLGVVMVTLRSGAVARRRGRDEASAATPAVRPVVAEHERLPWD
jgi:hypothetical protein